jgi:hypothetical protein
MKVHGYILATIMIIAVIHYFILFFKILIKDSSGFMAFRKVIEKNEKWYNVVFSGKYFTPFKVILVYLFIIIIYVFIFFR